MYYQAKFKIDSYVQGGTLIKAFIPGIEVNPKYFINKNGIANGEVRVDDDRLITAAQRGLLFALFRDISQHSNGYKTDKLVDEVKEDLKAKFCLDKQQDYFSLSDTTLIIAREFIDYVLDFTFNEGVPLKFKTFEVAKEWRNWSYLCFRYRECTICRKKHAQVHHLVTVGSGMNRSKVNHSKMPLIMLCPEHHKEAHDRGEETFCAKYHVAGIFVDIATLKALNIRGDYGEEANG